MGIVPANAHEKGGEGAGEVWSSWDLFDEIRGNHQQGHLSLEKEGLSLALLHPLDKKVHFLNSVGI
jgi:hypothetical protein